MSKKRELSGKARKLGRSNGCLLSVCVLDTAIRLVGALPVWVYGRRWLLGRLFSMLMGRLFSGLAAKKREFKA
jgi:hypothetical protein